MNRISTLLAPGKLWSAVIAIEAVAILTAVLPLWLVHPFKPQTPAGLSVTYALRSWAPIVMPLAVALIAAGSAVLWPRSGWWRRAVLIVLAGVAIGAGWLARQNPFERMFARLSTSAFAAPGGAGFVADDDLVLAVDVKGDAVAYPVRQLGYHHVVHDVAGGVPIVATY